MKLDFRLAGKEDVPAIVDMLADDMLGSTRENASRPIIEAYYDAFSAIDDDPNNELVVVENGQTIVGIFQITFIPYLSRQGAWRAQIESVRIHKDHRGRGVGREVFVWAIARAKQRNCKMVQLTSDKEREQAIRFYEQLGFKASHEGLKLWL